MYTLLLLEALTVGKFEALSKWKVGKCRRLL